MSAPIRSNNPLDWTAVDGISIDERAAPGRVKGKPQGIIALVGEFQKGPVNVVTAIGSTKEFIDTFGGYGSVSGGYKGYNALLDKKFGGLRVVRVTNATQAAATVTVLDASSGVVVTLTALTKGVWGNSVSYKVEAATDAQAGHFNFSLIYSEANSASRTELYKDCVDKADLVARLAAKSLLCSAAAGASALRPVNIGATALASGSDGAFADSDYTGSPSSVVGIRKLETPTDVNGIFCAEKSGATVNGALLTHINDSGVSPRMAFLCGPSGNTAAQGITDVASYRGDRAIYGWPWIYAYSPEGDANILTAPSSWIASVYSQTAPEIDLATVDSTALLAGVKGLEFADITRDTYISLLEAGIAAVEYDQDYGYKLRSGVSTTMDTSKQMIFRRRMTDEIQTAISSRSKFYQNKISRPTERKALVGDIKKYLQQNLKRLGRIEDYLVDDESLNTTDSLAAGEFHVITKVKLFGSMRFIVLHTEVGEAVVITQEAA